MGKLKKIKVHIADDHMVLIDGIKAVLKTDEEIDVVGSSLNGEDVIEWYKSNKSDVLVLDINMPKVDGIGVLQEFSNQTSRPRIVVLSSYDDIKLVKEVLKIGADGFLAKKCAGEQIVQAIKTVHNGEQYFSEGVQQKIVSLFSGADNESKQAQDGVFVSSITDRELSILKLIAKEFNTKEIGNQLHISVNTVETHRKNLIRKLKVKNAVGLAIYAHKNQLV
ncbi:response regulator transcription factor [Urechidicola vernalis]|uniref:Response regulator transcription factor n=1 Tax=Urechidicola vernalis TaxID=3075600 RepID=A0ABU2Y3U6_9FLAO|nr:response regulator transcription factor [Urechidicola sp. P050]MDT0552841.1 response regulator transcription factor [Urechidicola sp. P050]